MIDETVPSGLSGIEGGVISLAGISVSDVQNPGGTLTTVLAVSRGTIHVAAARSGGSVAGNGTASVTLHGTADQINALLQGTNYTAPSDYYGSDTLSVTTTDGGGRSSGPRSVAIVIDDIAIIEVLPLG